MNPLENTRRSVRTAPKELAFIQIFGDDGGKILNISDSGLSFESFAPVGPVKTLQFWFSLNLCERVEAMGEVIWLDSGTKVGGLRFVNPTERALQHIRQYSINTHSGARRTNGKQFASALAEASSDPVVAGTNERQLTEIPGHHPSGGALPQAHGPTKSAAAAPFGNMALESTDLISFERHREVSRKRFLWGLALGLFLASTTTVAVFRFWGPQPPVALSKSANVLFAASETAPERSAANAPSITDTADARRYRTLAEAPRLRVSDLENSSRKQASKDISLSPASATESDAAGTAIRMAAPVPSTGKKSLKQSATPQQLWSAVQAGDANASVALADRYLRGDGVPENCLQARVLLLVASEKKNATAIKMLEQLDKTGCPANSDQ